jgi:hypothetical protein
VIRCRRCAFEITEIAIQAAHPSAIGGFHHPDVLPPAFWACPGPP